MTLTDFITEPKSLLIAPAGHGKTYAIASCIKLCPIGEKQLVLTHTHAGISVRTHGQNLPRCTCRQFPSGGSQ